MRKTAFVYDPFNLRHTLEGHPENYRRLETTWALLQQDGILNDLLQAPSSPAPINAILRVHTPRYIETLQRMSHAGGGHVDGDTYVNPDSYHAALLAAGGLLNVTDMVLHGQADNGFALIRPPGHHALIQRGMGFCLFANVSIAARWAQDHHGLDRVLIVDFDVHHGNGTQDIFYEDPTVLFFSTHQYPHYPGTGRGTERGKGAGEGFTINVPMEAGEGDAEYHAIFLKSLVPAADAFKPEFVMISAGFDAHKDDPLASMGLTEAGYADLTDIVAGIAKRYANGRILSSLEGGYNLTALAYSVDAHIKALVSA